MKSKITRFIILTMIISIGLCMMLSSAKTTGYVTDGLVGFFDGDDNSNGTHNKQATVWKDLSGKGNDITVVLNETNFWEDNGYHLDTIEIPIPNAIRDAINGSEFTVEVVLDHFQTKGRDFNTFVNCNNDMFSLFRRIGNDVIEFKNNSNARPVTGAGEGLNYLKSQVTLTITYKVGGESTLYINGEKIMSKPATVAIGADSMFFGHKDATRNFSADYECLRFYNKELTAAQVSQNYNQDVAVNPTTGVEANLIYFAIILASAFVLYRVVLKKQRAY